MVGVMIHSASLKITPDILGLVAELDEFKGAWRALGTLPPKRLAALRQVATIESIGSSSRIEGNKLKDRDVEQLLADLETRSIEMWDDQNVAGYANTMERVLQSWQEIPLTEDQIRQLHIDLLRYREWDADHRGRYKTQPSSLAAFDEEGKQFGIVFETATPFDTPRLMAEVVDWVTETLETRQLHPLLVTAIFIVTFLEIHPFQDGNGRLSGILTTLLLLRAGYAYVPYSSLESVIEKSKEGYYLALRQTQGSIRSDTPNWQPWVLFFLRALQQQMNHLARKVEREKTILSAMPELSVQIIEFAREHGRVTISNIVTLTGTSRNTLKPHFRQLLGKGQLVLHGRGRGAWYALP
jgi:Fic family protein